jgi:HSP20 family protein
MAMRSLAPRSGSGLVRPEVLVFGTLQREIDRLLEDFARGVGPVDAQAIAKLIPNMDITETDNEIVVTAELPGLERGDIDISIQNDALVIRGEKRVEEEQRDQNFQLSERAYGTFYRVIQLPDGVDPSSIQATMANGVLKVTIPKPNRNETRKIEVKEGQGNGGKPAGNQGNGGSQAQGQGEAAQEAPAPAQSGGGEQAA